MEETFAEYILKEQDWIRKLEIMFYLNKKARIFFDKSVVFKAELAKLFVETMNIDVDSNLVITACLLCNCKKTTDFSDLEKVNAYKGILATNQKDRIALCCTFTDLLDFYDAKGNLINRLHGPEHFYTSFIEFNDGMMMGSRPDGNYYRDAFYSSFGGKEIGRASCRERV